MRDIKLSKRAAQKLQDLLEYLDTEWSESIKKKFVKELDQSFRLIKRNPTCFPKTDFVKDLHRCVVTKHITIYYTYDESTIFIITLFDNRQNPQRIGKEINL